MVIKLIINKIKYIKREKIYIIYTDDVEFNVLEDTLVRYNLYKGKEIDIEDINNIILENKRYEAKKLSIKYLSNMKSEKQVRDHLKNNNIEQDIIDDTIFYLNEEKFLDDYEYASLFSRDKLKLNKYGKNKIRLSLKSKGIDNNIIDEVLLDIPEDIEYENLLNAARKKIKSLNNDEKSYEKLVRHLIYKGYNYDLIKKAISEIKDAY